MTNNNEMPNEIYLFRNSNGGLELGPAPDSCDWLVNIKYIRADSQPADVTAALDALAKLVGAALFSAKDAHEYQAVHRHNETIRAALTAQQQQPDVNAEIDLDNAREVFENWLTGNGNYPHLKHKSFGGQYLNEEAAMKWDGFKAGYYARAEQKAEV